MQGKMITQKKSSSKPKPKTRAKKNEWLLLTCSPLLSRTAMEIVADSLIMTIVEIDGHLYQIASTRIARNKIYGSGHEVRELAPSMFG